MLVVLRRVFQFIIDVVDGIFVFFDAFSETTHEFRNFFAAKEYKYYKENDQQFLSAYDS